MLKLIVSTFGRLIYNSKLKYRSSCALHYTKRQYNYVYMYTYKHIEMNGIMYIKPVTTRTGFIYSYHCHFKAVIVKITMRFAFIITTHLYI